MNNIIYSDPCLGNATQFSIKDTVGITGITWNFGDPSSGTNNSTTGLSVSHLFSQVGNFNIQAILSNAIGSMDTLYLTITIISNTIALSSAVGSNSQSSCASIPISTITYATTGATGATFTGLPSGVTGSFASNTVTISGTPASAGNYPYTVTLSGGCEIVTASGIFNVFGELYIPTGFSPNNDGKNDVFRINIKNECVSDCNLKIYDRLGELIFESNTINSSWDGTYKGNLLNDGVFVYQLSISFSNSSKPVLKKGNLTLIK